MFQVLHFRNSALISVSTSEFDMLHLCLHVYLYLDLNLLLYTVSTPIAMFLVEDVLLLQMLMCTYEHIYVLYIYICTHTWPEIRLPSWC